MNILREDLAVRLIEERGRLSYSQSDFASKVGMSREGLRLYENGQRGIAAEFLAQAVALGVDVQYVLTGVRSNNLQDVERTANPEVAVSKSTGNIVGVVHSGATVHQINTQKHVTKTVAEVKPGTEHISEEQAVVLTGLVNKIVEKEAALKQEPKTHRSIWASLNSHCGVTKYRLIRAADFERARKYLDQWMGRLNSMASAPVKDGDEWRKRRYAYIKINAKDSQQALLDYIYRNFSAQSLCDLSNEELERTYRYVASRKSASTKKLSAVIRSTK